jgi:hypothetical protein
MEYNLDQKSLIYLAVPYSHEDPRVRQLRFETVNLAASYLMRAGLHVFSPISHSHPIALAGGLPTGWDYWEAYDTAVLSACRAFVVLMLTGWERSTGVRGETSVATRLHIPHYWAEPDGIDDVAQGKCPGKLPGLDRIIAALGEGNPS